MNGWQRWLHAPATHWLYRLLRLIHLWIGIGFGLYLVAISVSGSAIVLRPQINRWFVPSQVEISDQVPLSGAALEEAVAQVYAPDPVLRVAASPRPGRAVYVVLRRAGAEHTRFFDQYRGMDLGPTFPWQVATVEWLTLFHDELLLGQAGRRLNGVGGVLLLVMVLSGLLLWWQGRERWRQGLQITRRNPRPLLWQVHSFFGFWSLLLLFAWGLTAVYFAWSAPFDALMDLFDDDLGDLDRPDGWLLFLIDLHFGRFRGTLWASLLWVVLGLLPAVMFVTGFILWYKRVIRHPGSERGSRTGRS